MWPAQFPWYVFLSTWGHRPAGSSGKEACLPYGPARDNSCAVCTGAGRGPRTRRPVFQHWNCGACETPLQGPHHTCKLRQVLSCTTCCRPGREAHPSQSRPSQRAVTANARLLQGDPGPSPGLSLGWRRRLLQPQSTPGGQAVTSLATRWLCRPWLPPAWSCLSPFLEGVHISEESCSINRASLVAQLVKNLLAMQETPVQFLGQEDPLEKG